MSPAANNLSTSQRKPWCEPTLIRHQSLMAVTRAPLSPEMIETAMTASMVMMQICGSTGFVGCPGAQELEPNAPPAPGYSGW